MHPLLKFISFIHIFAASVVVLVACSDQNDEDEDKVNINNVWSFEKFPDYDSKFSNLDSKTSSEIIGLNSKNKKSSNLRSWNYDMVSDRPFSLAKMEVGYKLFKSNNDFEIGNGDAYLKCILNNQGGLDLHFGISFHDTDLGFDMGMARIKYRFDNGPVYYSEMNFSQLNHRNKYLELLIDEELFESSYNSSILKISLSDYTYREDFISIPMTNFSGIYHGCQEIKKIGVNPSAVMDKLSERFISILNSSSGMDLSKSNITIIMKFNDNGRIEKYNISVNSESKNSQEVTSALDNIKSRNLFELKFSPITNVSYEGLPREIFEKNNRELIFHLK